GNVAPGASVEARGSEILRNLRGDRTGARIHSRCRITGADLLVEIVVARQQRHRRIRGSGREPVQLIKPAPCLVRGKSAAKARAKVFFEAAFDRIREK